jgi:hypothetical protein
MSIENAESRMLIDGKLVRATGERTYENVNPATEEVIGKVADATPADMDRAIARRAAPSTRPSGRRTGSSASAASSSSTRRSTRPGRSSARRSWPRSARRSA